VEPKNFRPVLCPSAQALLPTFRRERLSACHTAGSMIPVVSESLPACRIRPDCQWFLQEGSAACRRCPQIVTYCVNPSENLSLAASPEARF
jgi:hypothetical protein